MSLDMPQRIVAVADIISALTGTRSYKDAFSKEKTVSILKDMADNGLIDSMIVSMFVENYDTIMGAVRRRSQPILDKYHEMQRQYQVLERRMEDRNSQAAPWNPEQGILRREILSRGTLSQEILSRIMLSHGIVRKCILTQLAKLDKVGLYEERKKEES